MSLLTTLRRRGGVAPVITANTWGLWLMDEGSGTTTADSSGNDKTLDLQDGVTVAYNPTWETEGLGFSNSFLWRSGDKPTLSSGYTFSVAVLWAYSSESSPGLFCLGDGASKNNFRLTSTNTAAWFTYLDAATDSLYIRHNEKDSSANVQTAGNFLAGGAWHLIQLVHDGTSASILVDGTEEQAATALAAVSSTSTNFAIGMGDPNNMWEGKIGVAKMDTAALSSAQLAQDADYIKSVMAGRGVTLPFDAASVGATRVACLYDEDLSWDSSGNIEEWGA